MRRLLSRKSHSWWWDSHISRKNSKWLAQNLENMDKGVKEMLKLIEEEGESFAQKAEMYYQKRPQLISYVEDIYRMYRALAERYDQVTDDLRKNVESELRSEGSCSGSDRELTPRAKPQLPKSKARAAGFDVFLGSGGSSDLAKKDSDGLSSSSSESDSEPEFDDTSEVNGDDVASRLRQRVQELEDELLEVKEKLKMEEEKNNHDKGNFKTLLLEEELSAANGRLDTAETEIMDLKWKLEVTNTSLDAKIIEVNLEKKKVTDLEEHIVMLQNEISGLKNEAETLKGAAEAAAKQFETEVSSCASTIDECKNELDNSSETFHQKSILEAKSVDPDMVIRAEVEKMPQKNLVLEIRISGLGNVIQELNASTAGSNNKILSEKSALEAKIDTLSKSNAALEDKVTILGYQMRQLEVEKTQQCNEKNKHIDELNSNLDALRVKADMLTAEKEAFASKMDSLINDIKQRDDQIFQVDKHVHHLHLQHTKLIVDIEETARNNSDLKSRLKELEEELDKQKAANSDGAEGKREAIRQLCFSLEYYRDAYHQLQHLLQVHRRLAILER